MNQPKSDSFWDQKVPDWAKPIIGIGGMFVVVMLIGGWLVTIDQKQRVERAKWHMKVTLSDERIFHVRSVSTYNAGFFANGESIVSMQTCSGGQIKITGMTTTETEKIMAPCPDKEEAND